MKEVFPWNQNWAYISINSTNILRKLSSQNFDTEITVDEIWVFYARYYAMYCANLMSSTFLESRTCMESVFCFKYVRKILRKINISKPTICTRTCAYQGGRNVSFSEHFAYVCNGWFFNMFTTSNNRKWQISFFFFFVKYSVVLHHISV